MPNFIILHEIAKMKQAFGQQNAGYTRGMHLQGPRPLSASVPQNQPSANNDQQIRRFVMYEEVDPQTSERRFMLEDR
jgi:hypothetical protein